MGPDLAWKHSATQLYVNIAVRHRQTEIQNVQSSSTVPSFNPSK